MLSEDLMCRCGILLDRIDSERSQSPICMMLLLILGFMLIDREFSWFSTSPFVPRLQTSLRGSSRSRTLCWCWRVIFRVELRMSAAF